MQYDENAEKYGYEGEMTPLKCDELNAYKGDVYIPVYGSIADADVYLKKEADAVIAKLKKENLNLKAKNISLKSFYYLHGNVDNYIDKLKAENSELKQKLESVQASMYCDVVDAGMRERRLKRALYKACANWAKVRQRAGYFSWTLWGKMKDKCLNKMKEYK